MIRFCGVEVRGRGKREEEGEKRELSKFFNHRLVRYSRLHIHHWGNKIVFSVEERK